jgi:arsenate reductase
MRFASQSFDYVITVCDRARQSCPVFPGGGEVLHWGIDDPAEAEGTDAQRQAAFDRALRELSGRIHAFVPLASPNAV